MSGIDALLQQLLDEKGTIAMRVVTRVRTEMPNFESVPLEEHRAGIEAAIELIVGSRMNDPDPSFGGGAAFLRELGERRARQGIPVDDLLRSWRLGIQETTAHARELADRSGARPDELFDLFQQAFGLADEAMVSISSGHRREPTAGDPETARRAALVRNALLGRLSADELHSGFAAIGLDPLASYRAFRARGDASADIAALDEALDLVQPAGGRVGLVAAVESEVAGFSSEPPPRGALPLIAIGPAVGVADLPSSYLAAGRVLGAADRFGLAGVHDLTSAGLQAAVIEDANLGDALVEQLVAPVLEVPSGPEILAAVREWLGAGMRVDPAAERLFVHANTIRYRLKRYGELTGADLDVTEDAFRVWWALQRHEVATAAEE